MGGGNILNKMGIDKNKKGDKAKILKNTGFIIVAIIILLIVVFMMYKYFTRSRSVSPIYYAPPTQGGSSNKLFSFLNFRK